MAKQRLPIFYIHYYTSVNGGVALAICGVKALHKTAARLKFKKRFKKVKKIITVEPSSGNRIIDGAAI